MKTINVDFSAKSEKKLKAVNGVCNGPIVGVKDFTEEFREINVPFVRLHDTGYGNKPYFVDISHIFTNFDADENDPSNYLFHHTDQLLKAILASGAQPIYRLGESIDHTIYKRTARPPKDFEKWARICVNIIRHYNDGWADGFKMNLKYWEIWNEPECGNTNGEGQMWYGGTIEQAYELYKVAVTAIKSYDSSLKVGGMANCWANREHREFIEFCEKENLPLDFASYHGYIYKITDLTESSADVRKWLDDNGYPNAEIIFDEWNYFYDDDFDDNIGGLWLGCRQDPAVAEKLYDSQKNQIGASFVAASMIAMNESDIDIAAYYDAQYTLSWCGIFGKYGAKTKTFYAFKAYGLMRASGGVTVKATSGADGVYAAAVHGDDADYVLISNYRGEAGYYEVDMSSICGENTAAEIYVIDKEHEFDLYRTEYFHSKHVKQTVYMDKNSVVFIKISADKN